jgi:hypothetical protein
MDENVSVGQEMAVLRENRRVKQAVIRTGLVMPLHRIGRSSESG